MRQAGSIDSIPIPLPHVGTVNAWLLRGDPLTLVDTGPRSDAALAALERGLQQRGLRVEHVELVIGTHHHHDHVGLAATIQRRSGARLAIASRAADYCADYPASVAADRRFSRRLMREHGVPTGLIPLGDGLWDYIDETAESFDTDARLDEGDHIFAGGRELVVAARPGHSATDTLLVDHAARVAFVGDHLLAKISSNTEIYACDETGTDRSESRLHYIQSLKLTAPMPLVRLYTGHGPPVTAHADLIKRRLGQHRRRCGRISLALETGPRTAYDIAADLWSAAIVREQPLLVVWEVLGHLDLLRAAGVAQERVDHHGRRCYSLVRKPRRHAGLRGGKRLVPAH
jgi:glyoxylase-like metal-dependent hydrolase (beta-lactamase superfamily II)